MKTHADPKHILIFASVWPEPRSSAAGTRMITLITHFRALSWKVTLACAAEQSEFSHDFSDSGVEPLPIPLNDSALEPMLSACNPDWVLFDRFMTEEQFSWRVAACLPHAFRILDTVDLHTLRHAREQAAKQQREPQEEDFDSTIAHREIASIYRSDLTLLLTQTEADILTNQYGLSPNLIHILPLTAPTPHPEHWRALNDRQHFIHIGNFKHPPNWDAVQWLHQDLWPRIRKELPHAELHLYGAYAPPKATQLHSPEQGFHVRGRADDAQDVISQARVCLAPLRFGAGMKGKLLDAFLTGTPSVTTPIGAEGMHGTHPWPGHIASTSDKLVQAAVSLYQKSSDWAQAQQHILPILTNHLNQERHLAQLQHRLEAHALSMTTHRRQNFIGSMLWHHAHRSTEYMARWIEAKNLGKHSSHKVP